MIRRFLNWLFRRQMTDEWFEGYAVGRDAERLLSECYG